VGSPFYWQYGEHAPILTPQGTLIMHDNGNYRAMPFVTGMVASNSYSRAVEYSINEQTMEVSQVWEYGQTNADQVLFSDHEGNAEPLPITGNVLIDFAAVSYVNGAPPSPYGASATMTRITEVTHDDVPQIVFDLAISLYAKTNLPYRDCGVYRAHRIPDLYAHPARPVADLSVTLNNGAPLLQFSADDTRAYTVQASTNLLDWDAIGVPGEDDALDGNFSFEDDQVSRVPIRYYRIVTQ
jgi:arylsulfate sulfotransferase